MRKLAGGLCVMGAGGMLWYRLIREARRRTRVMGELALALEEMAEEIRRNRTPMPRLLAKAARGRSREVTAFFTAVELESPEYGLDGAWRKAAGRLPLAEEEVGAVAEAGCALPGDEEQVCRGLRTAADALRRALQARRETAAEAERRCTALCFSASALMIILLM